MVHFNGLQFSLESSPGFLQQGPVCFSIVEHAPEFPDLRMQGDDLSLLFCLSCAYLFYSSLAETGLGALVGVSVLLAGLPVVWLALPRNAN